MPRETKENKREREERRRRMLAREHGQPMGEGIPGTSGHIGLSTPRRVRRTATPPPPVGGDKAGESTARRTQPLTPLLQERQRRRRTAMVVAVLAVSLLVAVLTGAFSASIALLGDAVDSITLYMGRAGAGWPVNTGLREPLQVEELSGGFVELDREDAVVYSAYGQRVSTLSTGYARPVLAVGGSRYVVYNRAGTELKVASRTRTLFTQTFDNALLVCAMSDNGTLAAVTESDRYAAQLQVYDPSFRRIYNWEMTQSVGTPIALDFAPDNRRFAAGTLRAEGGQLQGKVYFMNTSQDREGPVYTASQGSMLVLLDWQTDTRVVAVFDTYIAVLDPRTATETARYDFGGATLQSAAPGRSQTALLLNVRGGNTLLTLDAKLTPLAEIPARQAFAITATETDIYLLCAGSVENYGYDGLQKWVKTDLDSRPFAVLDAAEILLFTGSTAEVLQGPGA